MDAIKIDNFRRTYPGVSFPQFEPLDSQGCRDIRQRLAHRLGLEAGAPPLEIVKELQSQAGIVLGEVPDSGQLELRSTLRSVEIEVSDRAFLNWYRFDDIDQIGIDDLSQYFDDIWYPASDDMDLLDGTLNWVLSISHDGRMVLRRLPEP